MSDTPDIRDFLYRRIAEDEFIALDAIRPAEMHPYGDTRMLPTPVAKWGEAVQGYLGGTWGDHCAQWNPTRVLAECQAKRDTIALQVPTGGLATQWVVLRNMAAVYADHPEYQKIWTL